MKSTNKRQHFALASIVVAAVFASSSSVHATIVFQDDFNRTGPLNGSTPSMTAGSNWTAHPGFSTDGTKVSAAFGLFEFTVPAYVPMPVAITSGNVYTLSATMHRGLSTDNLAIMIFGFFDATPDYTNYGSGFVDGGNAIAIAPRNNRPGIAPMLNGATYISDIPVADGTDGVTFGVRLYETSPNAWSAVAVELAPTNQLLLSPVSPVPISIANIHSIGMISSSLLPPYIDNFTLDVSPVVPEPSSAMLCALGIAVEAAWCARNRKVS